MQSGLLQIMTSNKHISVSEGKKVYFASDNHLGAPTSDASRPREKKFVAWLDEVKQDAAAIFLLGDLFDFWFEYKSVVPKGFTRTLGKLAEISDSGMNPKSLNLTTPLFLLVMAMAWVLETRVINV